MPSPGNRGFYAEVDEMLLIEFEKLFPSVGSKVLLITNALIYAIQNKTLFLNPGGGDVYRRQGTPASSSTEDSRDDDILEPGS